MISMILMCSTSATVRRAAGIIELLPPTHSEKDQDWVSVKAPREQNAPSDSVWEKGQD